MKNRVNWPAGLMTQLVMKLCLALVRSVLFQFFSDQRKYLSHGFRSCFQFVLDSRARHQSDRNFPLCLRGLVRLSRCVALCIFSRNQLRSKMAARLETTARTVLFLSLRCQRKGTNFVLQLNWPIQK